MRKKDYCPAAIQRNDGLCIVSVLVYYHAAAIACARMRDCDGQRPISLQNQAIIRRTGGGVLYSFLTALFARPESHRIFLGLD